MRRFIILLCILFGVVLSVSVLIRLRAPEESTASAARLVIGACPTYAAVAERAEGMETVPTGSTGEGLALLRSGDVDYVLSGRPPKPGEEGFETVFLAMDGYSFIADREMTVGIWDVRAKGVCTDRDPEVVRRDTGIADVIRVPNVYGCIGERVGVTSWDRTDYRRAGVVHVIQEDGSRFPLSRTPVLYCSGPCPVPVSEVLRDAYARLRGELL